MSRAVVLADRVRGLEAERAVRPVSVVMVDELAENVP
jgi:hypothetical protein